MAKTVMSELVVRMTAETAALKAEMERVRRSVDTAAKNMSAEFAKSQKSVDSLAGGFKALGGIMAASFAGFSLVAVTKQVMNLHDGLVTFQRGLGAVSGSTAETGKNMAFVTNLAARLGMNINDLRKTFVSFAGSVKGTALEGEAMRKIMEAMATTGKNLGLSGEAMQRAFVAVSQMAAKGVVSMEELRGQLGEAMPGALQAMARAMNMSMPDFIAFVSQGQALAEEVLPKWAAEMDKANQSTVNASSGFKTFAEVLTAISNEFQLFFENMTSADLMAKSTGADWRAIVAGMLDLLNVMNDMMATSRKLAEHQKTVEGQWEAARAKLEELKTEYNNLVTSYLTSRSTLEALRTEIENQQRVVDLLKQTMEEAKVAVDEFAGAQDWAAKATERANATMKFRQDIGIGGGASVDLLDQITKTKHESLRQYEAYIDELARTSGMEKNLILSILHFEGGMDWQTGKNKVSPAGAIGPMQVMPDLEYLKQIGAGIESISDLEDPFKNLAAGVAVWKDKLKQANGDVADATRRYNGAGAEARKYSDNVMGLYEALNQASGQQGQMAKATTSVTQTIKAQEQAIAMLKDQMASAASLDQVTKIKDEVAARETLLRGLKNIDEAENRLVEVQAKVTKAYYEIKDPRKEMLSDLEKERALKDYVIKQTVNEVKAVQDAQGAYQQLQKDVQIDTAIDTNVRALKDEKEALDAATKGAKDKAEAQDKLLKTLDDLLTKQAQYVQSLQKEAIAAQDELLKAQDPAAYNEYVRARERAVVVGKELISTYEQEALAALDAKYAAEDALESLQMRQGWANSILQGFDQLWSNMISGAENAMDALKKTLKSWLYAIGQWLLKQAIIIPITAQMFNVSEKSLGGGLLGALAGNQGSGGQVVSLLTDLRGESQKTAENTGDTVKGLGGLAGVFGNLITGLAGGLWQFLAAILTALTTGNMAKAGESMITAGSSIMSGMSGIKDFFSKGAWSLGGAAPADAAFNARFAARTGTAVPGGGGGQIGAGWYGAAGIAGYYGANALYQGKGYSGMGGSLGAMGGMKLGAMYGSTFGPIGTAVGAVLGAIAGSVAGGKLGSMFGGEKIKGGVGYYDFNKRRAGAAHRDTDPAVVEMMQKLGSTMVGLDNALRSIQGFGDMWNFGASMWLDTDTKGRMAANYNSYSRGLQKSSFKAADDAAKWFVDQMVEDVKKQFDLHGQDMGGIGAAITNIFKGLNAEQLEAELGNLAQSLPALMTAFTGLSKPLQNEVAGIARWHAKSLDDISAMMIMAGDVQKGYTTSLWEVYQATKNLQQGGESLSQAYQRVIGQFTALQDAFLMIHGAILPVTKGTLWWGDALAKAAGGLDQLVALQSFYFENFYSDAERQVAAQKLAQVEVDKFNATLGLTGAAAIDTKEELRSYIESLNLWTQEGMDAYIAALKMAGAINTLGNAMNDAGEITYGFVNSLSAYMEKALKPSDDIGSQEQSFFENFYSDVERQAAQVEQWKKQVEAFNATLGLTGASAIDTKEELRAYIESLNLETDAGRKAYEQAMKLVSALLGLEDIFSKITLPSGFKEGMEDLREGMEKAVAFATSLSAYMEKTLKPGDDLPGQEQKFFENFYTDAEKQAAQIAQWKKQVDAFNATLGLTGALAIDTKDELRRYIESLDLETAAGRKAYEQAMKLVDAILGLSGAMGGLGDSITKIKEWAENAQKVSWDEDIEPPKDFKTALDKAWDLLDLSIVTGSQNYIDQLADVLDGLEQSAKQYIATLNNLNKEFQNWVEEQRSFWFKNQNEARQPPWLKGYADYDKRLKQSRYGEDWWKMGISGHEMDIAGQQRNAQQATLDYYQKALAATDPEKFSANFQDAWDFMLKSNALGGKPMLNPADMEKMLQWAKERMDKLTEQEKEKVKEQYKQLAQAIAEAIAKAFGVEPKATLHATIDKFEPIITINIEDHREETTYTAEVD